MTYLVAMNLGASAVIIADARVTRSGSGLINSSNDALKTAAIGDNCILGVSGNAANGRVFVDELKQWVLPGPEDSLSTRIANFSIAREKTPRGQQKFMVPIAVHVGGAVDLRIYDSTSGLTRSFPRGSVVAIGSGRSVLDKPLIQDFMPFYEQTFAADETIGYTLAPDFISFQLTLMANGLQRQFLEKAGVGGLFHYVYLNPGEAGTQHPSVTVVVHVDIRRKIVTCEQFRVSSLHGALVCEYMTVPIDLQPVFGQQVKGDRKIEINWDPVRRPMPPSLGRERAELLTEIDAQPYYRFLGIGFAIPFPRRPNYIAHAGMESPPIIDRSGYMSDRLLDWLQTELAYLL